nr:nucleotidyltransferase family protein [Desulfogranum mediterraneum]
MLREYCRGFVDWQGVLRRAEREGMAPLLRRQLLASGSLFPDTVRRSLNILYRRHQHQAKVRSELLLEILEICRRNQLTPIVIKGAALCHTLYPDPALRPMRDIDLLFQQDEVDRAQELLLAAGFSQSASPIPADHHHLPAIHKTVGELDLYVELHRGLYPHCPPYYPEVDFAYLLESSERFMLAGVEVLTFNHEEMLHYLFQHGFRAPLSYEPYRLIHAADIIGFVERHYHSLDWQHLQRHYPILVRALPLLHHISPWNFKRVPEPFLPQGERGKRREPLPFRGWPQRRFKELEGKERLAGVLSATFIPPLWWLKVYYGLGSWWGVVVARCILHPRQVFWWVHLYSHFVIVTPQQHSPGAESRLHSLRQFLLSSWNKALGVWRKLRSLS